MLRRLAICVVLTGAVLGAISASTAVAITPPAGLQDVQFVDNSGDCGQTPVVGIPGNRSGLEVYFTVDTLGVDSEGPGFVDRFQVTLRDSAGVYLGSNEGIANYPATPGVLPQVYILVHNFTPASNAPTTRPWVVVVEDMVFDGGNMTLVERGTLIIDPAQYNAACASLPFVDVPTSDPVNDGANDLVFTVYNAQDADENPVLHVYGVNAQGQGTLALIITQDDIAPYAGNPPTENTEILASADGFIHVYVLDTGEIQINAGPDAEGKTYVTIFDGIPPTNVYGYVIDPPQ